MKRARTELGHLEVQVLEDGGHFAVSIAHPGGRSLVLNAKRLPTLQAALAEAAERIARKQATAPARSPWQA